MSLPIRFNQLNALQQTFLVDEIMVMNDETRAYGLTLSPTEIRDVLESRQSFLKGYGRVELDAEATKKLIRAISDSPFLTQEEYAQVLIALHELFYYIKNETNDRLEDDQLIRILRDFYNQLGGSLEMMDGRGLFDFIREYKEGRCSTDDMEV